MFNHEKTVLLGTILRDPLTLARTRSRNYTQIVEKWRFDRFSLQFLKNENRVNIE